MIPVQLVADAMFRVYLVKDLISIFLGCSCEDDYLENFTDFLEKFLSKRSNMEDLGFIIIMD